MDLVAPLLEAAGEAIRNQRPSIESDAGTLRSITLELELSNAGDIIDSRYFTERRGVHRRRGTAA